MTAIRGKHVLITGGASGIGRLMAARTAKLGATVTVLDVAAGELQRTVAEIDAGRQMVRGYVCDVGDRIAVNRVAARVIEEAGPVDILVNNAGVVSGRRLLELSDEQIERTLRVNTLALFWMTRAFLPYMIDRGSGHVVTVASCAGIVGTRKMTDYAASKHAAMGFHEALRMELRERAPHVRTTIVCPYYIDTRLFQGVRKSRLLPVLAPDFVAERIVRAVQRDEHRVVLPHRALTLYAMRLLPTTAFDWYVDMTGANAAMDTFQDGAVASHQSAHR
jgi:all-trans-retinol dehydrogenase (NAD+)